MNRKLVIATVAASALAVGGTTAAFAGGTDDAAAVHAQDDDRDAARDDGRDDARALSDAKVTVKEAVDKALASVQGGTVESVELDDENDRVVWEADVLGENGTWHEVRVDAGSGDVSRAQAGDDDSGDDRGGDDRDDD